MIRRRALPIFATITRISIADYNNWFVEKNMTSVLKHSENYPQMQSDVNTIIDTLNDHIYEINKLTNVSTPFLHTTIMEKRGSKKSRRGRYYKYRYDMLYDGCHPSYQLCDLWSESLSKAMSKNDDLEDSDSDSMPKRANGWRDN